jgi:cholesterol oxidase
MTAGLQFDEQLTGSWSPEEAPDVGNVGQFLEAAEEGDAAGRGLEIELHMVTSDVERLIDDLSAPLTATGMVAAGGLLADPVAVVGGRVELVVADDPVDASVEHMRYHLPLPAAGLHLEGFKILTDGDVTQLWSASTTLYVTVHKEGPDGPVVGRGVARIGPVAFARLLSTLDITGEDARVRQLALLARFGASFFGALWDDYGTVVHRSTRLKRNAPPRLHRPLDVPPREVLDYRSADGYDLRLTRYRGGDRGPVVLVHGMGANPLTYTLDTIQPNLVEYLVGHGFDVWLQEWRGSTALPSRSQQFDADEVARHDHPAAEAAVRAATGRQDVHWVTHCVGSMTWMMSVLGGWATPASLVLSQVGAHPVAPRLTKLKAQLRAPNLLRALGVKLLTTDAYDDESFGARLFDQALRLHPVPREERCDAAVCRRLAFIYGIAVHHAAVDDETHDSLHELFGMTDMTMMAHLGRCAREERLVAADGADAYLPNVERAALPMTFISGAHNLVWLPESTRRTHDWLVDALGPDGFTRVVLDQHGHQDTFMGAEAYERAFPAVLAHLERAGC